MSTDEYACGHKYNKPGGEDRFFEVQCPECYNTRRPTEERSTAELIDRYRGFSPDPRSPQFSQLVELLVSYMITNKIPPDEMRDAAFVASIKFLQMHPTDLVYRRDDL